MQVPRKALSLAACGVAMLLIERQSASQTQTQEIQQRIVASAQEKAEELAALARLSALGSLHPAADAEFRRWSLAVRVWKQEKATDAGALLAEGVLYDCLGRLQGVKTSPMVDERALPLFADLASKRPQRALKAFEGALKLNQNLGEARLRAARILALTSAKGLVELERIATAPGDPALSYLAALSRAAIAHERGDAQAAIRWYESALNLNTASTAAAIGLSTLRPASRLQVDLLDATDLYYTYPCRILTTPVAAELTRRIQSVPLK